MYSVDLLGYLPPYLQTYEEIKHCLRAEEPEFVLFQEAAGRVLNNMFVDTADAAGITRLERMLRIFPGIDETLEERRNRIKIRWIGRYQKRLQAVKEMLESLFGDKFEIETDFSRGYTLTMTIYYLGVNDTREITAFLEKIIPQNMVLKITLKEPLTGISYAGGFISQADVLTLRQEET